MAQIQNNNNKSKLGVFKKTYNATIGRIFNRPRQPQASIRTTKSPPEPSPPLTKPAHIVHHPIEFEHHKNKNNNVTIFSPKYLHSNDSSQEVALPRGHVEYGDQGKKLKLSKTNKRFSDYINKVKDKRTTSNVGTLGSDAQRSVTKRDSFNDKVSNYITLAKFKIRTTTSVGDDKFK